MLQVRQTSSEFLHPVGGREIGALIEHVRQEVRVLGGRSVSLKLSKTHIDVVAKGLVGLGAAPRADNGELDRQIAVRQEACQRRQELATSEVAGGAEQNKGEWLGRFDRLRWLSRATRFRMHYGCGRHGVSFLVFSFYFLPSSSLAAAVTLPGSNPKCR